MPHLSSAITTASHLSFSLTKSSERKKAAMAAGWEGANRDELYTAMETMGYKLALALPTDHFNYYERA